MVVYVIRDEIGYRQSAREESLFRPTEPGTRHRHYCDITILDVLLMLSVEDLTKGTENGKL